MPAMRSHLSLQLAEFVRRGQWRRCLDILQCLVVSTPAAGAQAACTEYVARVEPDSVSAVLVLCGQALYAAPSASASAARSHSGNCEDNVSENALLCSGCSRAESDSPSLSCSELNSRESCDTSFCLPQRHEWRLLVTSLLASFTASAAASALSSNSVAKQTRRGTKNNRESSLSSSLDADHADVACAVADLCEWAERVHLGVDPSLLMKARRASHARHTSRTSRRLAAAWRSATDSVVPPLFKRTVIPTTALQQARMFRGEEAIRAGFRHAVARLNTPEEAAASADFVVSTYYTITQRTVAERSRRSGEFHPHTSFPQLIPLFCDLCEAVLTKLVDLSEATTTATSELRSVVQESVVVVSAAELSVMELSMEVPFPCFAERQLHTARALRHLSCAVNALSSIQLSATRKDASSATGVPSVPPILLFGSGRLAQALAEIRGCGSGVGRDSASYQAAHLLHLLVRAVGVVHGEGGNDGTETPHPRAAEHLLLSAVHHHQQACTDLSEDFVSLLRNSLWLPSSPRGDRCGDDGAPLQTRALHSYSNQTGYHEQGVEFSTYAASASSFAEELVTVKNHSCAFVCHVLDSCPMWLSDALLLGRACMGNRQHVDGQALSPVEEQHLVSALQTLSCGLPHYFTSGRGSGGCVVDGTNERGPHEESIADASSCSLPFLSRLFAHLSADTQARCVQQLTSVNAADTPSDFPRVLHCVLDAITDPKLRGAVAQKALRHCTSEARTAYSTFPAAAARHDVDVLGVLMASLLSNPVTRASTSAACMQLCLASFTRRMQCVTSDASVSYDVGITLCEGVRRWVMSDTPLYLHHHAQLFREASSARQEGAEEPSTQSATLNGDMLGGSAAAQCAAFLHAQPLRFSSTPTPAQWGYTRARCEATGLCIRRLCRLVTHELRHNDGFRSTQPTQAATVTATASFSASSAKRDTKRRRATSTNACSNMDRHLWRLCSAVCSCSYDHAGVATLCHLAVASAPTSPSAACALVDSFSSRASSLPFASTSEADVFPSGPFFTLRMASSTSTQEGPLNVLQRHHGTLLSETQHTQLVQAMRDFSHRRGIREALALFYSLERSNRQLSLAEVELFAEVAKRAAPAFLVRLLTYAPAPPCESTVLASGVIVGAWKSYQRVWRQYTQAKQAKKELHRSSSRASPLENGSAAFKGNCKDLHSTKSRQTVEQAWYESVAIALQATELLPLSPPLTSDTQNHARIQTLLSTLYRLVHASPVSDSRDASIGEAEDAGVWDPKQVRASVVLSLLLSSSSSRLRVQQGEPGRRSRVELLQQTSDFCAAQHDAETAVRAYMRFVRAHHMAALARASSSSEHPPFGQTREGQEEQDVKAEDGRNDDFLFTRIHWTAEVDAATVPLLSMATYVLLLTLSRTHVTTTEAALKGWPATLAANAAAMNVLGKDGGVVPPSPSLSLDDDNSDNINNSSSRDGDNAHDAEGGSDMDESCRLRAAMEGRTEKQGLPAQETAATAHHHEDCDASVTSREVTTSRMAGADARAAYAAASSAQRRAHAFEVHCAASLASISATLPRSLRRKAEQDMSLTPLVSVLHDALRWCRLTPSSSSSSLAAMREGNGNDTVFDTAWMVDEEALDDARMAGAEVLARILSSTLHLHFTEMRVGACNATPSSSLPLLCDPTQPGQGSEASVEPVDVVVCRVCTCRLPHEAASWKLLRHADALLEYVLRYVRELYEVEQTVLWVSPTQQQRVEVAVAECVQVVLAAVEAVDAWAANYKALLLQEQQQDGYGGGVTAPAPHRQQSKRSCDGRQKSQDEGDAHHSTMDDFRVRLRGVPLRLIQELLSICEAAATTASWKAPDAAVTRRVLCTLTRVLHGDVTVLERCSPADPALRQLCRSLVSSSPPRGERSGPSSTHAHHKPAAASALTSLRPVEELLQVCTEAHYAALSVFLEEVVFAGVDEEEEEAEADAAVGRGWRGKRLAYVLRCVSADSDISGSGGGVGAQALLVRVAAADATLRRLSAQLVGTLAALETARNVDSKTNQCGLPQHNARVDQAGSEDDGATASAAVSAKRLRLMPRLLSATQAFGEAAVLLDECTAWWNALHLESSLDGDTAPCHSLLRHIRGQLACLHDRLLDLYATAWWSMVVPTVERRFPEAAARLWSSKDVRFQHLYVGSALQHRSLHAGSAAARQAAEKLQRTLMHYPPVSPLAHPLNSRDSAGRQQGCDAVMDMETLLNDGTTTATDAREARHSQLVERAIVTFLAQTPSNSIEGVGQRTQVEAQALEKVFQAALACLSRQDASLLWRTLALVFMDDGAAAAAPQIRVTPTAHTQWSSSSKIAEAATCTVPTTLWQLYTELAQMRGIDGKAAATDKVPEGEGGGGGDGGRWDVQSLLAVSLLSPVPLLLDGLFTHSLLRQQVLQELRCHPSHRGCNETWLRRLITYGVDEAADAAHVHDTAADSDTLFQAPNDGEAGSSMDPSTRSPPAASYMSVALADAAAASLSNEANRAITTGRFSLLPSSLCQRLVPSLVLATLRDPSLVPERSPAMLTSSSSSSFSSSGAASREALLHDLVCFLGYVAPQAWRVALRWIEGTPYPALSPSIAQKAVGRSDGSDGDAAMETRSGAEVCALKRLREAFLSCGPWPAEVAQPLLASVLQRQRCWAVRCRTAMPAITSCEREAWGDVFPEAAELHQLFSAQSPSSTPSASSTAWYGHASDMETTHHPLLSPVLQRYAEGGTAESLCFSSFFGSSVADTSHQRRFRVSPSTLPPPLAPMNTQSNNAISASNGFHLQGGPLRAVNAAAPLVVSASTHAASRLSPLAAAVPPALGALVRCLTAASSLPACARLMRGRSWKEAVQTLRRRELVPALRLVWETLLLREAELGTAAVLRGSNSHSTRGFLPRKGATTETFVRDAVQGAGPEPQPLTLEESAWLEVCAALFHVTARASLRLTVMRFHSRTKAAKMHDVAVQLAALKTQICRSAVSALLQHVLVDYREPAPSLSRGAASADIAATMETGVETQLHGIMVKYAQSTCLAHDSAGDHEDTVTTYASQGKSIQTGHGTAAAAAAAATATKQQELPDEMLLHLRTAAADLFRSTETPNSDAEWLLWPPAAWEAWRLIQQQQQQQQQASPRVSRSETHCTDQLQLRNPLLMVALMRAWQRRRRDSRDAKPFASEAAVDPDPAQSLVDVYADLLARVFMEGASSTAAGSEEQQAAPSSRTMPTLNDTQPHQSLSSSSSASLSPRVRVIAQWSLMQLWSCVDEYVRCGSARLPDVAPALLTSLSAVPDFKAGGEAAPRDAQDASSGARGAAIVMEAFLRLLSSEDARMQRQTRSQTPDTAACATELLIFRAVLRALRPLLLGGHDDRTAGTLLTTARTAQESSPWASYLPQSEGREQVAEAMHDSRSSDNDRTTSKSSATTTAWHSFLHVLHLCTDGLLDSSAQRRGRRAAPSAVAMACVAQKLEALHALHGAAQEKDSVGCHEGKQVDTAHRHDRPLLSWADGQRILCWQLRQLRRIQTHVSALGWTVEQQHQVREAHGCLRVSVSCVAAHVQRRGRGQDERAGVTAESSVRHCNPVEAATAACFYPHLDTLCHAVERRSSEAGHQRTRSGEGTARSPPRSRRTVGGSKQEDEEEVGTSFGQHRSATATAAAAAAAAHAKKHGETLATVLLDGVQQVLRQPLANDSATRTLTADDAELQVDYTTLRMYLAAVLGNVVRRRQRDSDLQLLLDFLSGAEAQRTLQALQHTSDTVADALLRILKHFLCRIVVAHTENREPGETSADAGAVVDAGLRLVVALRPWLQVRLDDADTTVTVVRRRQITDASLALVWCALNQTDVQSHRAVAELASCVLHDVVHLDQAEKLSACGVALLGAIHRCLVEAGAGSSSFFRRSATGAETQRCGERDSSASTSFVDTEKVLWRVLHALAPLTEREAAEVHEIWHSYAVFCLPRKREAAAAAQGTRAEVARGLYEDTVALVGSSSSGMTRMNEQFFAAAVRLRTWWSASVKANSAASGSGDAFPPSPEPAQLHVCEDLLCEELAGGSPFRNRESSSRSKSGEVQGRHRAARRVLTDYSLKYEALRELCSAEAAFVEGEARVRGGTRAAAVIVLRLSVAALLLPMLPSPPTETMSDEHRDPYSLPDAYLLELLSTVVPHFPRVFHELAGANEKVPTAVATSRRVVRVQLRADLQNIACHLLRVMNQQMRCRTYGEKARAAAAASAFQPLWSSWEAILTPLRALRCVAALHEGRDEVLLLRTPCGLQCLPFVPHATPTKIQRGSFPRPARIAPFYITLRGLASWPHCLFRVPLRVLLHELLLPLLVMEMTEASRTSTNALENAQQLQNRRMLLRDVAEQLSGHPALFTWRARGADSADDRHACAAPSRLASAIEAAARLTITASNGCASASDVIADEREKEASFFTSAAAHEESDLQGWPAALVILKVLARLEELLANRSSSSHHRVNQCEATAPPLHPSPSTDFTMAFAARYAASLAQRGSALEDYLAFMLVAQHYCAQPRHQRDAAAAPEPSSHAAAPYSGEGSGRTSSLMEHDRARLQHAVTATAPVSSVGSVLALFRRSATPSQAGSACHCRTTAPSRSSEKRSQDDVTMLLKGMNSAEKDERAVLVVISAATVAETAELNKLRLLLEASR